MTTPRRVQDQSVFLLHYRPFRDSSQILDILSRDYGKLALVARGSRGARSRLRGILRPFMPLSMSWLLKSDLGTLTGAEIRGAPLRLTGDALLSGYYANELLIHFLHRHDPQPEIFDTYEQTLQALAASEQVAPCLRQFEVELLRHTGYAMNLEYEWQSNARLDPEAYYEYRVEQGPVPVSRHEGRLVFRGKTLSAIEARAFDQPDILKAATRLMRAVIDYHLGGRELNSRRILADIHKL